MRLFGIFRRKRLVGVNLIGIDEALKETFSDHLKEVKGKVIYFDGKNYWRKGVNNNG